MRLVPLVLSIVIPSGMIAHSWGLSYRVLRA